MSKPFYNTTGLTGDELKNAIARAKSLEQSILLLFKNTNRGWSPSQVLKLMQKAGKQQPITSIRRAITNLTSAGDLVKSPEQVLGLYNDPEHVWVINRKKYPSMQGTQESLFNDKKTA